MMLFMCHVGNKQSFFFILFKKITLKTPWTFLRSYKYIRMKNPAAAKNTVRYENEKCRLVTTDIKRTRNSNLDLTQ